jgi:hypothetical protein
MQNRIDYEGLQNRSQKHTKKLLSQKDFFDSLQISHNLSLRVHIRSDGKVNVRIARADLSFHRFPIITPLLQQWLKTLEACPSRSPTPLLRDLFLSKQVDFSGSGDKVINQRSRRSNVTLFNYCGNIGHEGEWAENPRFRGLFF